MKEDIGILFFRSKRTCLHLSLLSPSSSVIIISFKYFILGCIKHEISKACKNRQNSVFFLGMSYITLQSCTTASAGRVQAGHQQVSLNGWGRREFSGIKRGTCRCESPSWVRREKCGLQSCFLMALPPAPAGCRQLLLAACGDGVFCMCTSQTLKAGTEPGLLLLGELRSTELLLPCAVHLLSPFPIWSRDCSLPSYFLR